MVYQIYYDDGNRPRQILFDIEWFIKENNDKKWYVEMHSDSFISGVVEFLKDKFVKDTICSDKVEDLFDWKEFKKDCYELEELRGWLWETHNNSPRTMDEADNDADEWGKYIKEMIYNFAKKYNLAINID